MNDDEISESRPRDDGRDLPRRLLWIGAVSPLVLTVVAWLWFFAAWKFLPDVSRETAAQQKDAMFWASDLPLQVFGGLMVLSGLILSAYLVLRKHGWLAVPVCIYYGAAAIAVGVGSFFFIPFKPPGW